MTSRLDLESKIKIQNLIADSPPNTDDFPTSLGEWEVIEPSSLFLGRMQ